MGERNEVQEIFDRVVGHLRRQGRQSVDDSRSMCAYRGADGLRCAVGFLIADEHYDPELEGCQVGNLRVRRALKMSGVPSDDPVVLNLLGELQRVHDCVPILAAFPEHIERGFERIAGDFGLTLKPREG